MHGHTREQSQHGLSAAVAGDCELTRSPDRTHLFHKFITSGGSLWNPALLPRRPHSEAVRIPRGPSGPLEAGRGQEPFDDGHQQYMPWKSGLTLQQQKAVGSMIQPPSVYPT